MKSFTDNPVDVKYFQLRLPSNIKEKKLVQNEINNNWFINNYYEKADEGNNEEEKAEEKSHLVKKKKCN